MNQLPKTAGLFELPLFTEPRGDITVLELGQILPFNPSRLFVVNGVPPGTSRGGHAHKLCEQFLICTSGAVTVELDDGSQRSSVLLDRRNLGLLIPALVWGRQIYHEIEASLLVLASHNYDAADYIHDYGEFMQIRNRIDN